MIWKVQSQSNFIHFLFPYVWINYSNGNYNKHNYFFLIIIVLYVSIFIYYIYMAAHLTNESGQCTTDLLNATRLDKAIGENAFF